MNNFIAPAALLQRIERLLENPKGVRTTMFRGDTPVFRATVLKVEHFSGVLTFTTVGTEIHALLAGKPSWNSTDQLGATRTAVRLNEYTVHKAEANKVRLTKPAVGKGTASSYLIELITD